jgi:regulator of protease activity HflC (stomatin/prohibitin superfamily)
MIVLLRVILLIIVIFVLVRFLSFKKSSEESGLKEFTGTPQPVILLDNSTVIAQVSFEYSVTDMKAFKSIANPVRALELLSIVSLRNFAVEVKDKSDLETKKEEINNNLKNILVETAQKYGMELTNVYVIFGEKNEFM